MLCRRDETEFLLSFAAGSSSTSVPAILTVDELALTSFFVFLPLRENIDPNI